MLRACMGSLPANVAGRMARKVPQTPLITIIGATGTGKSQLAVEIANRYDGEIINGDAMQLYAGLPIITNKISFEEQQGVPHHLLGCIGLHEQTWCVSTFVRQALKTIEDVHSRGKLPILVGGTHYYTQSLLFQRRCVEEEGSLGDSTFVDDPSKQWPILQEPTEVLLDELKRVDPLMAERWHPSDRRKIQRSLEIYLSTGKRASEIYAAQKRDRRDRSQSSADTTAESSLRFPTLIIWIHAQKDALHQRLDQRVNNMMDAGLLEEVETLCAFAKSEAARGKAVDESRGIWVSIGYKEFKDYTKLKAAHNSNQKRLQESRSSAIETTKNHTRQYSKSQIRWIRVKLANALLEAGAENFFLLDSSNATAFDQEVVAPAAHLAGQFLGGLDLPSPSSLSPLAAELLVPKRDDISSAPEKWLKHYCDLCNVTCVIEEQWQKHIQSKSHRKLVSKQKNACSTPTGRLRPSAGILQT